MHGPHRVLSHVCAAAAAIALLATARDCPAAPGFAAHVEGGFGVCRAAPPHIDADAFMAQAGLSCPTGHGLRATLELAASGDFELGYVLGGTHGDCWNQAALRTILVGLERASAGDARGLFACVGAGIGRTMLPDATVRSSDPGFTPSHRPARDLVGFAFGLGVGARTSGALGFQIGGRYHAVASGGRIAASTAALTLGLVY